jgi:hypothetical protein
MAYNQSHDWLRIGVVGYSGRKFDEAVARAELTRIFNEEMETREADPGRIEIVSGLTNVGVPKIAYELAADFGMKTVGISASRALTADEGVFPVDKQIIVGENYGDESEEFVSYIDVLVRIGGGQQSRDEVEMFRERFDGDDASLGRCLVEVELPELKKVD